ncbi:MinD/ParA family protein [Pseudalkalibacillus sp. SCS-8]|uniref:MinD/ParA family protein n=1 Tax=Pseudalkalibacillus nanhaiensis TaxID=3115291 RepID=UPI0032DB06EE
MYDQAEMLRKRLTSSVKPAKVCAVVSGKGGVGKSNVTLNLALSLIESGSKVLILDLDIGMANLDILMGVHSKNHIVDMVEQEHSILEMIETGPGGIEYIAGGNALNKLFELTPSQFNHFVEQIKIIQEGYDYIFLDMAAGASKDGLKFIAAADEVLLVTTPEPTAITDAYAMMKHIHAVVESINVSVIVNRMENKHEGEDVGLRIQHAAERFLQKEIRVLGGLPEDRQVFTAVKAQTPYLIGAPNAKVSLAMKRLASTFGNGTDASAQVGESFLQRFTRYFSKKRGAK